VARDPPARAQGGLVAWWTPGEEHRVGRGDGRLLLFRHGPVTEAWRGRLYGHADAEPEPLDHVKPWAGPVDHVVSSDLSRARLTAEALFPAVAAVADPRLRETSYGELEGQDLLALHEAQPTLWDRWLREPDTFRFPGGETWSEVRARALAAVEEARLVAPDGVVAVVSHGGVIRCIVAAVLGASAHGTGRLRVSPLHHVELRFWSGVPVVERTNVSA